MKLSSIQIFLVRLHWRPIGSYSSDNPEEKKNKLKAQPLRLIGHKEIVNYSELCTVTDSFVEQCM